MEDALPTPAPLVAPDMTAAGVEQTVDEYRIDDLQLQTFLLESGRLTHEQRDTALQAQQHTGHPLWRTVINLGLLTPQEIIEIIKTQGPPVQGQPTNGAMSESPEPGQAVVPQSSSATWCGGSSRWMKLPRQSRSSIPQGMILVTGPIGSGKTTTLYAALNEVNILTNNIVTIEDPVEYQLPGINQVEVDTKIGLTFASGLRSILRQDADILMVGEIRDVETATVAVRAALTGQQFFSTLHTVDAPSAITTLGNFGIQPYLLASALSGVVAQRLVRRICPTCRRWYTPSPAVLQPFRSQIEPAGVAVCLWGWL